MFQEKVFRIKTELSHTVQLYNDLKGCHISGPTGHRVKLMSVIKLSCNLEANDANRITLDVILKP